MGGRQPSQAGLAAQERRPAPEGRAEAQRPEQVAGRRPGKGRGTVNERRAHQPAGRPDHQARPGETHQKLMYRLTSLADPEVTGSARGQYRGASGSPMATASVDPAELRSEASRELRKGERLTQNRVAPVVNTDVSFTAQTIVSPDGREVRMTLNPVFNNFVGKMNVRPVASAIPGGPRP